MKEIAKKYGVGLNSVYDIKNRSTFYAMTAGIDFEKAKFFHKNREDMVYIVKTMLSDGKTRDEIIDHIMELFHMQRYEATYVYNYVCRDKAIVKMARSLGTETDGRYKYRDYMPDIEQALLNGVDSAKIIHWLVDALGLEYKKACDLVKQRVRAIINNNANIDLIGRDDDVERLRRLHDGRSNRREVLKKLNNKIDEMLISGDDFEDIVNMVRESGLISGVIISILTIFSNSCIIISQ
jgi:hypothetical protein